ncbi:Os12g0225700 [Oryza sativa Japonica Group]|uniref:Os12g0225700 protein n=1 Tax=Oryza sativa subsp. japonica TaxID=39947 RepID=Q0IPB8_ORYSJ|nr:Os12g0225700 [Oryza sativa Japonica Group]|eukprot:NP_001066428.1 Os12g0225700 [Oryza sativa Japonica Group]
MEVTVDMPSRGLSFLSYWKKEPPYAIDAHALVNLAEVLAYRPSILQQDLNHGVQCRATRLCSVLFCRRRWRVAGAPRHLPRPPPSHLCPVLAVSRCTVHPAVAWLEVEEDRREK